MAAELVVGGLLPLTTIDYPDRLAAVVFCQGCGWRCRYCHNPELLPMQPVNCEDQLAWHEVQRFMQRRVGLLDAIVFSGGEPTLQPAIEGAIQYAKALGFKVGLHSNGMLPERLQQLLPLLDWIGLDVKALPETYAAVTGNKQSGYRAWHSAQLVIDSGVAHQMRITVHSALTSQQEQQAIQAKLEAMGAQEVIIQQVQTGNCLDRTLSEAG